MDAQVIQFDEGWSQIKSAIDQLIEILWTPGKKRTALFTPPQYMEIYTICYKMCTQRSPLNWSQRLYQKHSDTIEQYLRDKVVPVLKEKRDEFLLKEMVLRWRNHEIMDKWMRKFFIYLDRYFVKHNSIPTLHEASLNKFRTLVFDEVRTEFVSAIIHQINKEREQEVVDRDLLKRCIAIFGHMGPALCVYKENFEGVFLDNTREFYAAKAQDWINQDTLPAYLIKAEAALQAERERVDNYIEAHTKSSLVKVVEDVLLAQHERTLLDKEGCNLRTLLQDDKKEDLSRLFRLFQNVDGGLPPIAAITREHICSLGEEVVARRESALAAAKTHKEKEALDPQFVQSLLDLHDKSEQLVSEQFQNQSYFQRALKEAFESFVNKDLGKTSSAELISTFCDRILKTGGAKLSEGDTEQYLEKCVRLFTYLSEKDLFSEVYRNQLAKRLLMGRSASDDTERSMIAKLKSRCGAQFTSKMEGMIKDLFTGNDLKKAFKEMARTDPEQLLPSNEGHTLSDAGPNDMIIVDGIEFGVEVLTTGHWPTYKQVDLALPEHMVICTEVYKRFYEAKTQHRCLRWVHSLGSAVVKANFKRNYDLQVTTLQAVALLAFNATNDWLTFDAVVAKINVDPEVAKRILHSLSCAKHKLLLKEPMSKSINRADKFKVNDNFQSPMRRIRIPMASLDESHNAKRVEEDRSNAIEAAIVRIMKARKRMAHHQLVAEVLSQLHFFRPDPRVVKRRIEHLIDREYLERDAEQSSIYKYLA